MKVKVGDQVFDSENGPVMVILSDNDKENIGNMSPDCSKYAVFPDDWGTVGDMYEWMENPS